MTVKENIRKILTGLSIPQEYVCLKTKELSFPLSVSLCPDTQPPLDVTSSHLFLGYKPLILALPFKVDDPYYHTLKAQTRVSLRFESPLLSVGPLAKLAAEKIGEKLIGDVALLLYEGKHGEHAFLNPFHQRVNRDLQRFRKQLPNNVSLPGNLIDQVRIAYCIPRTISIITLKGGPLMNMFPTDLHGPMGANYYAGSLRLGGKANEQVEKYGQIAISEVEPSFYKQAFGLGKNHMRELRNENEFPVNALRSKNFDVPLPDAATSYRELRKVDSIDYGIHRVHVYEVIHHQTVRSNTAALTHVHQYYAQWRLDHQLPTSMLLR